MWKCGYFPSREVHEGESGWELRERVFCYTVNEDGKPSGTTGTSEADPADGFKISGEVPAC
jgi:hypothetical protein